MIVLALLTVLVAFRASMLSTLVTQLAPDAPDRSPAARSRAAGERLATVAAAQHGNVVLHSSYLPFLGAGVVFRAWSMAMELRHDRDGAFDPTRQTVRQPVTIDPVELNRHVKRRLAALQSDQLPERERMTGLSLRDQIMASGSRWHRYALIDQERQLPFSMAHPHAMEAIIRHPRAGARHFLRASIGADSSAVTGDDGDTVMPAEQQNIVLSSFVHIAVEGGMLYVENVTTLLGPIRQEFLDIDRYRDGAGNLGAGALLAGLRDFGSGTTAAPFRLIRAGVRWLVVRRRINQADREHDREPVYDFGAHADVRQLASYREPTTYLQRLDAEKYAKLLERRISEAIVDHLRDRQVDTSEYETRINHIHNEGVTIHGDNRGSVAAGRAATATATVAASVGKE